MVSGQLLLATDARTDASNADLIAQLPWHRHLSPKAIWAGF
jgi:hypothetical protein